MQENKELAPIHLIYTQLTQIKKIKTKQNKNKLKLKQQQSRSVEFNASALVVSSLKWYNCCYLNTICLCQSVRLIPVTCSIRHFTKFTRAKTLH